MRYRNLLFILSFSFLIISNINLFAQGKGYLRGFISDSLNGEVIAYANVVVKGTTIGATTDSRGYFQIAAVPEGKQQVIFSCIGYTKQEKEIIIRSEKITQVKVELSPASVKLQEVSIIGQKAVRSNEADLGLENITPKQIEMLPTGVESDIFRFLQSTPGVRSTGDVTAKYYVRGGSSDQNLVLLNGATVYNPFHALGIFSVIDPEMISLMEFNKGAFPASYGGRLSSVLNIITKDGNKNSFHGNANASLMSGKAAVEGPIPYGSFIATGRKSYYSKVLKKYLNNKEAPFDFYDFSFKVNYADPDIITDGKLMAHGFISKDAILNDDPFQEDYTIRNNIFGINWQKVWSSPLFSVLNVSYSGFNAELIPNLSNSKPRVNDLSDLSAELNFTYMYPGGDELAFGLYSKIMDTKLGLVNLYGTRVDFQQTGTDFSGFVNYRFYRYENVGLDIGIRMKFLAFTKYRPYLFEPRVNFTWRPNPTLAFKAAIGRYSQEIVTISDENELISIFEPWIIIPDKVAASETTQLITGVKSYLSDQLIIELEGYYKILSNLLEINYEKFTAATRDYVNVDGEAYGLEFQLEYKPSDIYLKGSYALGWAYKIKNNKRYFPRYDSRHSMNILLAYELGSDWQVNSTWTLNTGMPFTPIDGFYDRMEIGNPWSSGYASGEYKPVINWGEKNSSRLPVYHRMDLSVTKKFQTSIADITLGGSIINVYDRKNIFYFDRDTGERIYMLPFFPSVSLRVDL